VTPERTHASSRTGTVILDIGGQIGAAVISTSAALDGAEVEIRGHGQPWRGQHTAIRARHTSTGTVYAAVFDTLEQGRYEAKLRGTTEVLQGSLAILGGQVSRYHLSPPNISTCRTP
jgi:hypothetical protein